MSPLREIRSTSILAGGQIDALKTWCSKTVVFVVDQAAEQGLGGECEVVVCYWRGGVAVDAGIWLAGGGKHDHEKMFAPTPSKADNTLAYSQHLFDVLTFPPPERSDTFDLCFE